MPWVYCQGILSCQGHYSTGQLPFLSQGKAPSLTSFSHSGLINIPISWHWEMKRDLFFLWSGMRMGKHKVMLFICTLCISYKESILYFAITTAGTIHDCMYHTYSKNKWKTLTIVPRKPNKLSGLINSNDLLRRELLLYETRITTVWEKHFTRRAPCIQIPCSCSILWQLYPVYVYLLAQYGLPRVVHLPMRHAYRHGTNCFISLLGSPLEQLTLYRTLKHPRKLLTHWHLIVFCDLPFTFAFASNLYFSYRDTIEQRCIS